jgi:VanZ family protein
MAARIISRLLAWALLAAAIALTVVPARFRPETGAPSWLEHFLLFLMLGSGFAFSYPGKKFALCFAALAFTATLEFVQLFVPGRHARLSDLLIDALSAWMGIALVSLFGGHKSRP